MKKTALAEAIRNTIAELKVIVEPDAMARYGTDWTSAYTPNPIAVVLPKKVEEVQAIVRFARQHKLALVPSGGRTGLSGGAVAAGGELVVAFDRMDKIGPVNTLEQTVVCQAGVVTAHLQQCAEQHGLLYPVDFASSGSSQIGGNISTNAGGIKVMRYGMTRQWVAGLTAVTGAGDIVRLNSSLSKNNTGYDLSQLFIGAEGTLGFVVEAVMRLTRQPRNLSVILLAAPNSSALASTLQLFRQTIELTACEFFSEQALRYVVDKGLATHPFASSSPFYALMEFESDEGQMLEPVMALFEQAVQKGWVNDGVISQNSSQYHSLWRCRECIGEAIAHRRPHKNDIAVPLSKLPQFFEAVPTVVRQAYADCEVIWFGHLGDGNIHLNVLKPDSWSQEIFAQHCHDVNQQIFAIVQQLGGSISAEHGVGLAKKGDLHYSRTTQEIDLMRAIKQVFDPDGIMNPGKIFDSTA